MTSLRGGVQTRNKRVRRRIRCDRDSLCCSPSFCLSVGTQAVGQESTAELRGRVLDAQEAPVPGATLTITNQATGVVRQAVSNADGTYFITAIAPGLYVARGAALGVLEVTAAVTSGSTSDERRRLTCS